MSRRVSFRVLRLNGERRNNKNWDLELVLPKRGGGPGGLVLCRIIFIFIFYLFVLLAIFFFVFLFLPFFAESLRLLSAILNYVLRVRGSGFGLVFFFPFGCFFLFFFLVCLCVCVLFCGSLYQGTLFPSLFWVGFFLFFVLSLVTGLLLTG